MQRPSTSPAAALATSERVAVHDRDGVRAVVARSAIAAGERLLHIEGVPTMSPSRYSVQVGVGRHIDVGATPTGRIWPFLEHSCEPNSRLEGTDLIAVRAIRPGEDVTFDYETNEWEMAAPFACRCGAAGCRGMIRGFRFLDAAGREALRTPPSEHLLLAANECG